MLSKSKRLVGLGVEKVAVGSGAITHPNYFESWGACRKSEVS